MSNAISYKFKTLTLCLASLALVTSCESMGERTQKGAAAGAAVGGIAGGAAGGGRGAAIGAAAGGALGAAAGRYLDQRQEELEKVVKTTKTEEGLKITLENDILFGFDEAALREPAKDTLTELAEILKKYPKDELTVMGWTDHIGSDDYNKQLSERRAEAVKEFLVAHDVDSDRVAAIGQGEVEQQAETAEGRQANRRVEIFVDMPQVQAEE